MAGSCGRFAVLVRDGRVVIVDRIHNRVVGQAGSVVTAQAAADLANASEAAAKLMRRALPAA